MRAGAAVLVAVLAGCAAGAARAEGDPVAGRVAYNKCVACHSIKAGENRVGPSLHGIVGRPSHSVEGFTYSPAMKAHDVVWDEATLNQYLIDPRAAVPNTRMIFPGIRNDAERENLVAYLATLK